jgi:hypothetical protein
MNEHRHRWADAPQSRDHRLSISCDECALQSSPVCGDCVVTFVLRATDASGVPQPVDGLVLDGDEARVLQLFGRAGLVPKLKFEVAG